MSSEEEAVYQPKDAVGLAIESTLITGAAGFAISAIHNSLTKQNVSAWGVFTRTGGVIAMLGPPPVFDASCERSILTAYSCRGRNIWIYESCSRKSTRKRR